MSSTSVVVVWLVSVASGCVAMLASAVWWSLAPDGDATRNAPAVAAAAGFGVVTLLANEGFYRLARMVSLREYVEARCADGADPEEALVDGRRIQELARRSRQ